MSSPCKATEVHNHEAMSRGWTWILQCPLRVCVECLIIKFCSMLSNEGDGKIMVPSYSHPEDHDLQLALTSSSIIIMVL